MGTIRKKKLVFELGCNRETKMGVRASGISNQNTSEYTSLESLEYRIHQNTVLCIRQCTGHDCRGGHYFIFCLLSPLSSLPNHSKTTHLFFETPPATTTLTTNDHCNHNKAIVSRRHRITTLPVTHRHGHNIRRSSDRCVADLHLYGTLEAK